MNARERVSAAIDFKAPDKVPVEYYCSPVGFYEHGEKLNDLYELHEGDFLPFRRGKIPVLTEAQFDKDGRYHETILDEWGTLWEFRIFGIAGIEKEYPLDDWDKLADYQMPRLPGWATDPIAFEKMAAEVKEHQKQFYYKYNNAISLFERLIALRPFEDVLCDLYTDEPYIIELLDKLTDYYEKIIAALIKAGVDCIHFGDDLGTQNTLIFSKDIFRAHFKPRYERLMKPIREAGIKISFHSCGQVKDLFPEFADLGVNAIWPQLPIYNMQELADTLRDMKIALTIHTDRAYTMTYGTPEDVKALVKKEFEIFRPNEGGAWFYVEPDNGMPYENLKALIETIWQYR